MFHLLTGADPQSNPLLIFDFTKNPRPCQIYSQLSTEMEVILMRAVEYNLQMRFASAAEMRDALQSHLDKIKAGKLTFATPAQFAPPTASKPAPQKAQSLVFCGFCGERIVPTDAFCAFCGTKQPEAVRAMASAHIQQQSTTPTGGVTAKLILESGALEEPAFTLEKDTNLVGREDRRSNIFPEVDLSRFDSLNKVSRRHARIWRQGSTFMIEDLGSANGTTLVSEGNQAFKLLAHQPRALTHGDKLKVGETTLHFFVN
jgi:serine/threonine-protein kinase